MPKSRQDVEKNTGPSPGVQFSDAVRDDAFRTDAVRAESNAQRYLQQLWRRQYAETLKNSLYNGNIPNKDI